jgi:hypothetical protein
MKGDDEEGDRYDYFDALLNSKSQENTAKSQQIDATKLKVNEYKAACTYGLPAYSLSYAFITRMGAEIRTIDVARETVANMVDEGLQQYWNHEPTIEGQNALIRNMQEAIDLSNATLVRLNAQGVELCGIINSINANRAPIVGIAIDPNDHYG